MKDCRPKKNTFDKICQSAVKTFSSRGYHKTTMDDIAAEAGLTKGAIYWHFKNKRGLFKFLIERRFKEFEALLSGALSSPYSPPVKIISALKVCTDYYENNRDFCMLLKVFHTEGLVITDSEFDSLLRAIYSRFREMIAAAINEGITGGFFSAEINPVIAGTMLMAAFDGLSFQWLIDPAAFSLNESLPLLTRIVEKGFCD